MRNRILRKFIALALVGATVATMPLVAEAAISENTKQVYADKGQNDEIDGPAFWKIETDTIQGDFVLGGVHYIGVWSQDWMKDYFHHAVGVFVLPALIKQEFQGYNHYIFKFDSNGGYKYEKMFIKCDKDFDKDSYDLAQAWETELEGHYNIRYDNVLNPDIWRPTTSPKSEYFNDIAAGEIVKYLKKKHADLVANNVALNARDESAALAEQAKLVPQRKAARLDAWKGARG